MSTLERKLMSQLRLGVTMMPRTTPVREDWIERSVELIGEYLVAEEREQQGRSPACR